MAAKAAERREPMNDQKSIEGPAVWVEEHGDALYSYSGML